MYNWYAGTAFFYGSSFFAQLIIHYTLYIINYQLYIINYQLYIKKRSAPFSATS